MSRRLTAAFQGIPGAYSEAAAHAILGARCRTIPVDTFEDVFLSVEKQRVDRGVVPIENSLAGSIHENYDLLLDHNVSIVGEVHRTIDHVLVGLRRSRFESLVQVRSHPQALSQCSRFFRRHRRLRSVPFFDTAGAARSLLEDNDPRIGAIASEHAAGLYRLKILRRRLENHPGNMTRFLLISRSPWKPVRGVPAKTSVAIRPAGNQVGILFRILGVFSLRDIDLTKIESRPDPGSPFSYLFYIDFRGSQTDTRVRRALEHLREMVADLRLLGTYPSDQVGG
jgi:prephenate dehydratase